MSVDKVFKIVIIFAVSLTCSCAPLRFSQHSDPYVPPKRQFVKKPKWALVLGAGGTKGVAHIGVIEELEKQGLTPDLIVGCSAGAIVGALYADKGSIDHIKQLMRTTKMADLVSYSIGRFKLLNTNKYELFLKDNIGSKVFEELKIPYVNVATNLEFGNLTVFSSGELVQSILASSTVPGFMMPQLIGEQYFVDGAIVDPVPVQVAKSLGADFVVAVDVSGLLTRNSPNSSMGVIKRSSEISYIAQVMSSLEKADYVIDFEFNEIGTFDDGNVKDLYNLGRQAGKIAAVDILQILKKRKLL